MKKVGLYIGALGIAGMALGLAGMGFFHHSASPNSLDMKDLNNDGRKDAIVRNYFGKNYIFLQQEDGSYKSLEEVSQDREEAIRQQTGEVEKKIQNE